MKIGSDCSKRVSKSTKKTKRSTSLISTSSTTSAELATKNISRLASETRPRLASVSLSSISQRALVLFDYEATLEEEGGGEEYQELSVKAGDAVFVIHIDDGAGWSLVSLHEKIGLIPRAYLKCEATQMEKKRSTIAFDFKKTNAEEVSVMAGEVVSVEGDLGDGWISISTDKDQKGIVPASYIQ
jgi:hypothetical protein